MNAKKNLILVLFAIFGLILTNLDLQAATYFVAPPPAGSDSNPGTNASPFATIQHAADLVNPGDTVTVKPGTYVGAKFSRSGSSVLQIVFQAQPGVVVNTPGSLNTNSDNLWVRNASYITIDGFESTAAGRSGIAVQGEPAPGEVHGIVIQNNNCHNNGRWGVFTGYAEGVIIRSNTTSFSGSEHGIYVSNSADNPVITGNSVHDNHASGVQINADPALDGDGIISNALIDSNIIYNNGVGGAAGINLASVINSQISNNLLYNNQAGGIAGWDDGNCPCGVSGTFIFGTHDNKIYNNTIVQPSTARFVISLLDGSTGNAIKNNILIHQGSRGSINVDSISQSGMDSDYNVVVNVFSADDGDTFINLAAWQALGFDQHSFVSNTAALFVNAGGNNFHLSDTSPAVNAGTPVSGVPLDLEGTSRPQGSAIDIGAYEAVLCVGDTTAPDTSVTSPANNATVGGTVQLNADASDDCALSKVEFYIDGNLVGTDTTSPFNVNWNSHSVTNGSHQLHSTAYDSASHQTDSATVNITVSNTDLFFDDFEDMDASDWNVVAGQWSVINGGLSSSPLKKASIISPNFGGCSQCVIHATLQIQTIGGRASVLGWYQSKSAFVEVAFFDDKNQVKLIQKSGGTTVTKKSASAPINAGAAYDVMVSYDGSHFTVAIGGTTYITVAAGANPSGLVGFKVAKGSLGPTTARLEQIAID
jgi:hypothetical protein